MKETEKRERKLHAPFLVRGSVPWSWSHELQTEEWCGWGAGGGHDKAVGAGPDPAGRGVSSRTVTPVTRLRALRQDECHQHAAARPPARPVGQLLSDGPPSCCRGDRGPGWEVGRDDRLASREREWLQTPGVGGRD